MCRYASADPPNPPALFCRTPCPHPQHAPAFQINHQRHILRLLAEVVLSTPMRLTRVSGTSLKRSAKSAFKLLLTVSQTRWGLARHVLQVHEAAQLADESSQSRAVAAVGGGKRVGCSKHLRQVLHSHSGISTTSTTAFAPMGRMLMRRCLLPRLQSYQPWQCGQTMASSLTGR